MSFDIDVESLTTDLSNHIGKYWNLSKKNPYILGNNPKNQMGDISFHKNLSSSMDIQYFPEILVKNRDIFVHGGITMSNFAKAHTQTLNMDV